MDEAYFLKPNIKAEPLVNQWYAWSHLISPATAALNLAFKQLKMLESFLKAPHLHMAAVKNPAMRGGPFIELGEEKVDAVAELLETTKVKASKLLDLAGAIRDLEKLLNEKAQGFAMQGLYEEIPVALQGYVELVYDLWQRPCYRIFEALLYESRFYNSGIQSIALSEITDEADRPFILSTPRLADEKTLLLSIPFNSENLDELFRMRYFPDSIDRIQNLLDVATRDETLFRSFFTQIQPELSCFPSPDKLRIRYFGHACLLIEYQNTAILIDPVVSYKVNSKVKRNTYEDLPTTIDFVLITHNHFDHFLIETLLQIRHKVKKIVVGRNMDGLLQDPSLKLLLGKLGFKNIHELSELEQIDLDTGFIKGIPFIGEHNDLLMHSKLCYYLNMSGHKILVMADSCNISPPLYNNVQRIIGDIDMLFIGMECEGAPASFFYGALLPEKPDYHKDRSRLARGCDFNECYQLVNCFNCKQVYVYAMGLEPWMKYILNVEYNEGSNAMVQSERLINQCLNEGRKAERLYAEKEIIL